MRRYFFCAAVRLTFPAALLFAIGPQLRAEKAVVASISASDLVEYSKQPVRVRVLIDNALSLTRKKLGYRYGSNSPSNGGMDCSGTVQHALGKVGVSLPRSAHTIYQWAQKSGALRKLPAGIRDRSHASLKNLKPGDLVFWEGTYTTGKRNPPISHVMIYLGTLKADGQPVIFGASSGRRYRGLKIHGVSVFDFAFPKAGSTAKIVAFSPIPGLR